MANRDLTDFRRLPFEAQSLLMQHAHFKTLAQGQGQIIARLEALLSDQRPEKHLLGEQASQVMRQWIRNADELMADGAALYWASRDGDEPPDLPGLLGDLGIDEPPAR